MSAADTLRALWIFAIFFVLFGWLPARGFSGRSHPVIGMRIAGNFVRMVLGVTLICISLAVAKLLSTVTLLILVAATATLPWIRNRGEKYGGVFPGLKAGVIDGLRAVETRSSASVLFARAGKPRLPQSWRRHVTPWLRELEGKEVGLACLAVMVTISVILRLGHAAGEFRLDQPDQYTVLLRAGEFLLNLHPVRRPVVFPAIVAVTAVVSGTDPAHVTHLLSPLIGLFIAFAAALLMGVCHRFGAASLAVLYCLGTTAFPVARDEAGGPVSLIEKVKSILSSSPATMAKNSEIEMGLLFLLLALALLADWYRNQRGGGAILDFACCLLLTGIVSPFLLLLLAFSGGILLFRPITGLIAFALASYGVAAYAILSSRFALPQVTTAILPVAAALLVGSVLAVLEAKLDAYVDRRAQMLLFAGGLFAALVWLHPQQLPSQHLEYESAARATQEIANRFPRQTWLVVAPIEQLPETVSLGAYEDLAEFVDKYQGRVSSPDFQFREAQKDLFIYVEKKPFQIFSSEPEAVSFSVLSDPTYRHYRSPAGRASLEAAALRLCEDYRQSHSYANVFFEDENLRIYRVREPQASVRASNR